MIEETKGLSAAEIRILLFTKTLNPFGDRPLVLSIEKIAQKLKMNKSTVSRALKKLKELGQITVEIIRKVTISTRVQNDNHERSPIKLGGLEEEKETVEGRGENKLKIDANNSQFWENNSDSKLSGLRSPVSLSSSLTPKFLGRVKDGKSNSSVQNGNAGCEIETKDAISHSSVQNGNNRATNSAPSKQSGASQTYTDFINTLSEVEREKFFNFVREKTKDFNPQIASLTDYLRSQSRYLELYSEFRRVVPVEERNFRIEDWKNQPEWTGILASIKRAGVAFIGIGGIDRKYADIPQPIRKKLVEYVRNNPEIS